MLYAPSIDYVCNVVVGLHVLVDGMFTNSYNHPRDVLLKAAHQRTHVKSSLAELLFHSK